MPIEDAPLVLTLLTVAALQYFMVSLVPRVDEQDASYRKFGALTALGIGYLVSLVLLLAIVSDGTGDPAATVLAVAVSAFALFGLTLLGQVYDDWVRLFFDPEFNTWVEAAMVLAVLVVLVVIGLVPP